MEFAGATSGFVENQECCEKVDGIRRKVEKRKKAEDWVTLRRRLTLSLPLPLSRT